MRWLHFSKVPHTDTCGVLSRPNLSSSSWEWQVKHGVSNGVWRDRVCLQGHTRCVTVTLCLSLHVQRLPLMHHRLSSYLQKKELFTQSEFFLFFFLMGWFIFFFSMSVNKGGQKVMPRWKRQRFLLRDDCTALLLLLAFKRHLDFLKIFYESELLLLTGQRR